MMDQHVDVKRILGAIYINLKRSEIAYRNYMDNGKQFIFARVLKRCNEETLNLLVDNSHVLPDDLIHDSIQIIAHLDVWIEKWNDLASTHHPDPEDEFIFENSVTFPRDAAHHLEEAFLRMQSQNN